MSVVVTRLLSAPDHQLLINLRELQLCCSLSTYVLVRVGSSWTGVCFETKKRKILMAVRFCPTTLVTNGLINAVDPVVIAVTSKPLRWHREVGVD